MVDAERIRAAVGSYPAVRLPAFGRREAAVLVPVVELHGGLSVLLTRRSKTLSKHAGEISFPGGEIEFHDASSLEAALREASEEIGLDPEGVEYLGDLDDTVTVTGYKIRPHVVLVKGPFSPRATAEEVDSVLTAPLDRFIETGRRYALFVEAKGQRLTFPLFTHEGNIVWGATARILSNLVDAIVGHDRDPFERFVRATIPRLLAARRVILTTHVHPDPDGIGCQIALEELLLSLGKEVLIANHDPIPERFSFLNFRSPVLLGDEISEKSAAEADLLFVVDTAEEARIGNAARLLPCMSGKIFVLDHHLAGTMPSDEMLLESRCSSTAELMYRYLTRLGFPLTQRAADALYAGIMFDTHGFRFVANRSDPFKVAAHLVDLGADASRVQEELFGSVSRTQVKVLQVALSRACWEFDGRWVWSHITRNEVDSLGATAEDMSEVAPFFCTIDGVAVATFLHESGPGEFKIALRSKRGHPIGHICQMLGGGGHANAGGATVREELAQIVSMIRNEVAKVLAKA